MLVHNKQDISLCSALLYNMMLVHLYLAVALPGRFAGCNHPAIQIIHEG